MPNALERCINIADLRVLARRRLPPMVFDFMDGGADDEISLRRNISAFQDYEFLPSVLVDVSAVKTGTRLFGRDIAMPLMLSPTGMSRLFHHAGEEAVARSAGREGLPYALSTMGTATIETIAETTSSPRLFQIYILKDRGITADFIRRAAEARFDGLILTVDTLATGNRERDRRHGLTMPPKLTPRNFLGFARHPGWSLRALRKNPLDLVNLEKSMTTALPSRYSLFEFSNSQVDRTLTWKDVEWIAREWGGPLAIKGLVTAGDARRAAESGASAVMISNHGGRQLDATVAPIRQVSSIAEAVGGKLEIIVDGGVRRGADIVKAIALGATACSIGRPYLYGLAARGEAGVAKAIAILRDELVRTMMLLGARDVASIANKHIVDIARTPAG